MSCSFCQSGIPLLRQLAGSQFCSDEHDRRHTELQKLLALARLEAARPVPRAAAPAVGRAIGPVLAGFARFSQPALCEESRASEIGSAPFARYCDVILSSPVMTQRRAIHVAAAQTARMPDPAAPVSARATCLLEPRPPASAIRRIVTLPPSIRVGLLDTALAISDRIDPPAPAAGARAISSPANPVQLLRSRIEFPPAIPVPPEFDWRYDADSSDADGSEDLPGEALSALPQPMLPASFWSGKPIEAAAGSKGPVYGAAPAFPLYPVWLPSLFALSEAASGFRPLPWPSSSQMPLPAAYRIQPFPNDGPGFSGRLAWPTRSAVYWEFRETWSPPSVFEVKSNLNMPAASDSFDWRASWRSMPQLARAAVFAVPLFFAAIFYGQNIRSSGGASGFNSLTAAVRARAAVDVQDDFRSGLGNWTGKGDWEGGWSFDQAGSMRPGKLALLRQSIRLSDYRLEFLGQIGAKGLSFAFRAPDTENYQAAKLVVVKPGPLPTLAFAHYTVIDGKPSGRVEAPLHLDARADSIYKVLVEVEGDHFSVTVNGQFAGAWSDDRLKSGGVGFFADKGELSRLRWVRVSDKQDFLGQLCYQVSQWTADSPAIGVIHEQPETLDKRR